MHLHQLSIENFKRVSAVTLTLPAGGGSFEIAGRNGQGKSSTIDAIWSALGGAKAAPEKPIREGSRAASLTLRIGDMTVRREWDARGTRLVVTDADGSRVSSPQTLLDSLYERLAFDPLAFTRLKPEAQAETLRRVAALDFADLEQQRDAAFAERTEVNRAIKQQEGAIAAMPEVEPAEEVSAAELTAELRAASRHNAGVDLQQRRLDQKRAEIAGLDREITHQLSEAERLRGMIAKLEADAEDLRERRQAATLLLETMEASAPRAIDPTPILDRIAAAEQVNRQARAYRERAAALEALAANRKHAEDLTDQLTYLDRAKAERLQAAPMPVAGLGLDGEVVTFEGIPFGQISSAQQIRVSLAMAAAMNPRLRLLVIREGSLLDHDSLRLVAEWAEEHGYQVLIERVADSLVGAGVVIEQGRVKAETSPALEPEPSLF
jgi:DNA repair exonuclease SbcCD ATPase subunit